MSDASTSPSSRPAALDPQRSTVGEAAQPGARADAAIPRRSRRKLVTAILIVTTIVVAIVAAAGFVVWSRIPVDLRSTLAPILDDSAGLALLFVAFLLTALGLVVARAFDAYVGGMLRLADRARVVVSANPDYRLPQEGPPEAIELAQLINQLAERRQSALREVELRVREANASLEVEKHRLAALMSEFTAAVVVCNRDGLILLYNDAAHALFAQETAAAPAGIVGLGRSVYGIIDRGVIAHAVDLVQERLRQGVARPVSQFVATTAGGRLIRAQMTPVRGAEGRETQTIGGFILALEDVTGAVRGGTATERRLQSLMEETRAGLASIRAAVETTLQFPSMEPARREQFTAIIHDEALRLSKRLDAMVTGGAAPASWPLEVISGDDLLSTVQRSIARLPEITVTADRNGEGRWVGADSFAVAQSLTALAAHLRDRFRVRDFALKLSAHGRFAGLELSWPGAHGVASEVARWQDEALDMADGQGRITLRDVTERHGGEHWCRADRDAGTVTYCMQLPVAAGVPAPVAPSRSDTRPVFYDFQLFDRATASSAFDERRLDDLIYTVFDTETTGLDPSAGDEIVSISAVRIVNGRLLRHEAFDELVDPRRPLSKDSVRIHGITPEKLRGKPRIAEVLPRFARFAEDTVLVGHNVAFDMRFLALKELETGVRFAQPVLDTLVLSAVLHPDRHDHDLEANAGRLGVAIVGRHTSLGDAIVTGEIFIKLIPLLAARGIVTLKDALVASQRSVLARVAY